MIYKIVWEVWKQFIGPFYRLWKYTVLLNFGHGWGSGKLKVRSGTMTSYIPMHVRIYSILGPPNGAKQEVPDSRFKIPSEDPD